MHVVGSETSVNSGRKEQRQLNASSSDRDPKHETQKQLMQAGREDNGDATANTDIEKEHLIIYNMMVKTNSTYDLCVATKTQHTKEKNEGRTHVAQTGRVARMYGWASTGNASTFNAGADNVGSCNEKNGKVGSDIRADEWVTEGGGCA